MGCCLESITVVACSYGKYVERLWSDARTNLLQAIAAPAGAGRIASALACLQILPTHKGHHYYQLIKHYCSKRNGSALGQIQLILAQDTRWQTYQQVPLSPW